MDDININPNLGPISKLVDQNGWTTQEHFFHFLADLPYKRISNQLEPTLVITEKRATCSSKHVLAYLLAQEQNWHQIGLQLVLFKMGPHNNSNLQAIFSSTSLSYLPEAHCRLTVNNLPLDLTFGYNQLKIVETDVLKIENCDAEKVLHQKVDWHKNHLKNWLQKEKVKMNLNQIWAIREACIQRLSIKKEG